MEQTMKTLVEAAQAGSQQAIAQLYEKTSKKAYYLAKQLLKDEDTAQDILQDSYVKVFANLHMLRQPENFQGWLDTIVVNKSNRYTYRRSPCCFLSFPPMRSRIRSWILRMSGTPSGRRLRWIIGKPSV